MTNENDIQRAIDTLRNANQILAEIFNLEESEIE